MPSPASPAEVAAAIFEALERRDLDAVGALQHDEVVDDFIPVGVYRGRQAIRGFFAELFAAVPDGAPVPERILEDGEYATVQWRIRGTFSGGSFQGVHATGRKVEVRGVDVMHIVDGRLLDNTIYWDNMSFASQIGMLPSTGSRGYRALTAAFNARTDLRARLPLLSRIGRGRT